MPGPIKTGGNGRNQSSPFSALRGFMTRLVSKPVVEEVATPQQVRPMISQIYSSFCSPLHPLARSCPSRER